MDVDIVHEKENQRFVATVEGRPSYLRYAPREEGVLDFVSTFVHRELRGRGVGEKLVKRALDHAREEGCRVIPSCWFVETVVARNPAYRDVLKG